MGIGARPGRWWMSPVRWSSLVCVGVSLAAGPAAEAAQKFALGMFHFNVQYVCGGTTGFLVNPDPTLDLDNDALEDRIIEESLAPVVELYEKHPSWGVDIEMQGYMLDVIAARHPALLDKLRALTNSGQLDVVSFHYSDQLFLGYPTEDWERSQELTRASFDRHGVALSRTVFCQEGQAAPGMAARMKERGYRTLVWPKNLWSFQHGDFDAEPLYQLGDVFMIAGAKGVSKTVNGESLEVAWTFFGDGELLATGDLDPYLVEFFFVKPELVAKYEAGLEALEAQGYRIASVDQYVTEVSRKVTATEAPKLLDGTWQPASTGGIKRWLGGSGLWLTQERDNHVRSLGAVAHRELVAAETAAKVSGIDAREKLDGAWRLLLLGQVTDGSGINPFRGEIQYAVSHVAEALRLAREVIDEAKGKLGHAAVVVDPAQGTVTHASGGAADADELSAAGMSIEPPIKLVIDAGGRAVTETWARLGEGHTRVSITFAAEGASTISVTFPGTLEPAFEVGLALDDSGVATVERAAYAFERFHFALPTGWIGLGGGRFLIKDMARCHLAAEIEREAAGVLVEDKTAASSESQRWVFHILEGSAAEAAALAKSVNVARRLVR
ncbi:MAG: hypothetical protein EXR75_04225 [Myxococcales bacterium]|nr:hypothetical protein [Myxococcales bacterium]